MKYNLKNKILTAALIVALFSCPSCRKPDFGTMNINPNLTTQPIPAALLTNALSAIGNRTWDAGGVATIAGLYCQYFTETQYTELSRYARTTNNWDAYYSGVIYDLQNIINYNTDPSTRDKAKVFGSNANQIAVARILKVYNYWQLTDLWGDMPYSLALQGNGVIAYDKQEAIYPDLLKELKEAVAGFDNGLAPKGDILYNGDLANWKRFGNSIRLLVALRLSKVNATLGKTEYASALADAAGVISDNSQSAILVYPGGNYLNPFNNYYNVTKRDDYSVALPLMDFLVTRNDLRKDIFGTSTIGFPYGLTRDAAVTFANANTNYSRLMAKSAATPTSPVPVLTAAHVSLARAEAANLGWSGENATALYNQGITQSWEQWGINNAAALSTYLANADVNLGGGEVAKKIATQQWIAWYPNGWQGWSGWRKTGYPALVPPAGLPIPRRLSYGTNEPQLNPANYTTAAAGYTGTDGADSQFARIWWDKP